MADPPSYLARSSGRTLRQGAAGTHGPKGWAQQSGQRSGPRPVPYLLLQGVWLSAWPEGRRRTGARGRHGCNEANSEMMRAAELTLTLPAVLLAPLRVWPQAR